ncbi:MAG: glycosyltransferase family 39 protein [Myxococcota bacterium]
MELALLALLAIGAALLRTIAWLRAGVLFNDGPTFLALARRFGDGNWWTALSHDYHPLYPLAISWVYRAIGSWEGAAVLLSVLSGSVAVIFLYRFLRDSFDLHVARVGALILAIHPWAVAYSSDVLSDGLYLALFLAAIATLWRAMTSGGARLAAGAGVLSGLAYLTRPEGVGVVLIGLGGSALLVARGRWSVGRGVGWAAALCAGTILAMAPYLGVLRVQNDAWVLTNKKSVAAMVGLDAMRPSSGTPLSGSAYARRGEPHSLLPGEPAATVTTPFAAAQRQNPSNMGRKERGVLGHLWRAAAPGLRYESILFVVVGLIARRRQLGRVDAMIGGSIALYLLVMSLLALGSGYVDRRHVLPPLVLTFGYAAIGVRIVGAAVLRVVSRWRSFASAPGARAATVTGVAILLLVMLPVDLRARRADSVDARRAAEWLRAQPALEGPVATSKARIAYYAGRTHVPLRPAPPSEFVEYLRNSRARYVIVTEDDFRALTGSVTDEVGDLRLIHREGEGEHRVLVYEVLQAVPADP